MEKDEGVLFFSYLVYWMILMTRLGPHGKKVKNSKTSKKYDITETSLEQLW